MFVVKDERIHVDGIPSMMLCYDLCENRGYGTFSDEELRLAPKPKFCSVI